MNELILLEDLGMQYPRETSKYKIRYGLYKCYCGNEFKTAVQSVKYGETKSCGCYHKKVSTKHNLCSHRLYSLWNGMIQRCNNISSKSNCNYAGRGITVCNEWKTFLPFYEWAINNGYEDNLSIDRIDNDKGYSPDNCRWATRTTQARNTRILKSTNTSGYRGVSFSKNKNKYVSKIRVNMKDIYLGTFLYAINAAKAYDDYIIINNLEHTRNFDD